MNMKEIEQVKQIINSMVAKSPIGAMKISSTILLNKINSIERKLEDERAIGEALQQMTGFKIGKWSGDVTELASSMGLKKKEWEHIKKNEDEGYLDKKDIDELDEYFKEGEND